MNKKILIYIISWLCIFQANTFALANDIFEEKHDITHYFDNIAISRIDSYGPNNIFAGYKLVLQPVILNKKNQTHFRHALSMPVRELGKPFWIITGNQLPVTEDTCISADLDDCESNPSDPFNTCYHSCATHGPEFLTYDKKNGDLYIISGTADVGQGGGGMLVFVANIHSKTIKFLRMIGGPVQAELSPSRENIAFFSGDEISVYNLKTRSDIAVIKSELNKIPVDNISAIDSLRWLNNTQFSYHENIYKNKFSTEIKVSTEYVYDLSRRSNISTKLLIDNK